MGAARQRALRRRRDRRRCRGGRRGPRRRDPNYIYHLDGNSFSCSKKMFDLQVKEEGSHEINCTNNDTTNKHRKGSRKVNQVYIRVMCKFNIYHVLAVTLLLNIYHCAVLSNIP